MVSPQALFGQNDHGAHQHIWEDLGLKPEHAAHMKGAQEIVFKGRAVAHVQPAIRDNQRQASAWLQEARPIDDKVTRQVGQA